jgi:hypothetical protein
MPKKPARARYFGFPHNDLLFDARLDAIREEPSDASKNGQNGHRGTDIVFEISAFEEDSTPQPAIIEGRPHEIAEGTYRPLALRFLRAAWVARDGAYANPAALPDDQHARRLFGVLHAREPQMGEFFWVMTGASEGQCVLRAHSYRIEERPGPRLPARITRRWAPPPPHPVGLVPHRPALYRRFAGDPVTVHLDGLAHRHHLFIGGLHHQRHERPAVDHVLNLCGVANNWVAASGQHSNDRLLCKGEMSAGMDARELLEEAAWVVERLRAGRRVLVHCYAGINRSATICCATLMLLEGLSADDALARIREQHPTAWPDPYHWFLLRWLSEHGLDAPADAADAEPAEPVATAVLRG